MKINDNGIEREMTEEEIANHSVIFAEIETNKNEQAQADADRQALKKATLAKLGLTAEEAAALLS
jgi:hypothetical protein